MTQDNWHLGKRSTTTGEPYGASRTAEDLADRAWLRQLGLDVEAKQPKHRTQVLWVGDYLFKLHCRTHGYMRSPKGATKGELEALARAHEEAFA